MAMGTRGAPLVLGAVPGAPWVLAGCCFRGCPLQGHGVSLRPGSCPHSHWPQLCPQVLNGLRCVCGCAPSLYTHVSMHTHTHKDAATCAHL